MVNPTSGHPSAPPRPRWNAPSTSSTSSSSSQHKVLRPPRPQPRPSSWDGSPTKSSLTTTRVLSSSGKSRSPPIEVEDDDFVMVSISPKMSKSHSSRTQLREPPSSAYRRPTSPSQTCGVSLAAQRLSLMETDDDHRPVEDDSPIRVPHGQSRSLGPGNALAGRRRSADEQDSPELGRSRMLGGGDDADNGGSWMKRSKASFSPFSQKSSSGSPPPPDTPVRHTSTSGSMFAPQLPYIHPASTNRLPPPQPRFPSLRTSQSHDSHQQVFMSPSPSIRFGQSSYKSSRSSDTSLQHTLLGRRPTDKDGSSKRSHSPDTTDSPFLSGPSDIAASGVDRPRKIALGMSSSSNHPHERPNLPRSNASPFSYAGSGSKSHRRQISTDSSGRSSLGSGSSVISRSHGHKSGLATATTSAMPTIPKSFSNESYTSVASSNGSASTSLTIPDPHIFDDIKPLQAAFQASEGPVSRKFKPRDSAVGVGEPLLVPESMLSGLGIEGIVIPKPDRLSQLLQTDLGKPTRPAFLKRASSCGDERPSPAETPGIGEPPAGSAWPNAFGFDFGIGIGGGSERKSMPDTPVKKGSFALGTAGKSSRVGHSFSHPTLSQYNSSQDLAALSGSAPSKDTRGSATDSAISSSSPDAMDICQTAPSRIIKTLGSGPTLTVTTAASSPDSPCGGTEAEELSPTVRIAGVGKSPYAALGVGRPSVGSASANVRMGLLRRLSSGMTTGSSETSEEEGTPTKSNGAAGGMLGPGAPHPRMVTPTPSPRFHTSNLPRGEIPSPLALGPHTARIISGESISGIAPRLSLPAFSLPKPGKRLNHRQSAPEQVATNEEDIFDTKFVVLEPLGKGAFSQVVKVQQREGTEVFAVKKARGVFDGVKDRLRHLEEVEILRHLSSKPHPHVLTFVDAWEQNRQLFIQTELCIGSLAFFLEEYGRVVERLDEGRAWKIARELADGISYIHNMGVIHFDLKPANILITPAGALKIGDFGLASRWPRIDAAAILEGSGLGGDVGPASSSCLGRITDREGDRVYMPPEMLQGQYSMAADIFSFGLIILEVSTNICVPDGGPPWHALRSNDFSPVDFSPLSPALTDLITNCMQANPAQRPIIADITNHPVISRARARGKEALAPEADMWLADILTNMVLPNSNGGQDEDVEMLDV